MTAVIATEAIIDSLLVTNRPSSTPNLRSTGMLKIIIGSATVVLVLLIGLFAPLLTHYGPQTQDLANRLTGPSGRHWFGTDELGRDSFARVLYAGRIDIPVALLATAIPGIIGCLLGAISGYAGRWVDTVIMRVGDLLQAFPTYVFLLVVVFIAGSGVKAYLIAAVVIFWVPFARLMRSEVLVLRELDYIRAARGTGLSRTRILVRHVIPNALPQAIIYSASQTVFCLLGLASLSFLGVGVTRLTPEWGALIAEGQAYVRTAWWISTIPGLLIVVVGGALAVVSDGLDQRSRI